MPKAPPKPDNPLSQTCHTKAFHRHFKLFANALNIVVLYIFSTLSKFTKPHASTSTLAFIVVCHVRFKVRGRWFTARHLLLVCYMHANAAVNTNTAAIWSAFYQELCVDSNSVHGNCRWLYANIAMYIGTCYPKYFQATSATFHTTHFKSISN